MASLFLNPYGWFVLYREVVTKQNTPATITITCNDLQRLPLFRLPLFRRVLKDVCNAQRLHTETMQLVEQLLELEDVEVDLVSNIANEYWCELLGRWKYECEQSQLFDRFSRTFTSYTVNGECVRKPQPAYFLEYMRQRQNGDRRIVLIDDSEANVAEARRCGMEAILYTGDAGALESDLIEHGVLLVKSRQ